LHIVHDGIQTRGEAQSLVLPFRDPEGQRLELVDDGGKLAGTPWRRSPVPAEMAIHGFYAVRLTERHLEPSARFLTEVLGFRPSSTYQTPQQTSVTVFEVGPGGPGTEVHIEIQPEWPVRRFVGIGGVHHVAFRTPNEEEHRQWRDQIAQVNPTVTPVIDRFYSYRAFTDALKAQAASRALQVLFESPRSTRHIILESMMRAPAVMMKALHGGYRGMHGATPSLPPGSGESGVRRRGGGAPAM